MDILQFKEKINPDYHFYFKEQERRGETHHREDIISFASRYDVQILKATPHNNRRAKNEVYFFIAPKAGTLFFYEKGRPFEVVKETPVKRAMTILANIDGKILAIPRERFMDEYHIDFNSNLDSYKPARQNKADIEIVKHYTENTQNR